MKLINGRKLVHPSTSYQEELRKIEERKPFRFDREHAGTLTPRSAVMQAIGAASMCWTTTPTGVFDSDRAVEVGEALLDEISDQLEARGIRL